MVAAEAQLAQANPASAQSPVSASSDRPAPNLD